MKTRIFIYPGITERYDNVFTDEVIVKGRLIVSGTIRAKNIYGDGIIEARRINAGSVVANTVDAEHIVARQIIANKITCLYAIVSAGIIANDYIEARSVKTARLIASQSSIDVTEASEIIRLKPKRKFITVIFVSWLYERFALWRHSHAVKKKAKVNNTVSKKDSDFEDIIKSYREKYSEGGYKLVLEAEDSKAV